MYGCKINNYGAINVVPFLDHPVHVM